MKKLQLIVVMAAMVIVTAAVALAADYRYVKQAEFKQWLESKKPLVIVDIQVPEEYRKRHFPGSEETNAYPVKTDAEKKRLESVLEKIGKTKDDVVIICPRGGGGAKNSYDYLLARGVEEKRLYILEKGIEGWAHPEMCVPGDR